MKQHGVGDALRTKRVVNVGVIVVLLVVLVLGVTWMSGSSVSVRTAIRKLGVRAARGVTTTRQGVAGGSLLFADSGATKTRTRGSGGVVGMCSNSSTDAETCDSNPLLMKSDFPLWASIKPEHVEPAMTAVLDELEAGLASLEESLASAEKSGTLTLDQVVPPLEKLSDPLGRVWGQVNHLKGVADSEELRAAHEKMQPRVVEVSQRISSSAPIYAAFKALRDGKAGQSWEAFSEAEQRVIEGAVKDAELSGVGLEGDAKTRFVEIKTRLSKLSTSFSNNLLDATKAFKELITDPADVDGLPTTALELASETAKKNGHEAATAEAGPWMFTLDAPSYIGVMQHAKNRALREKVYRAYLTRSSDKSTAENDKDNAEIIDEILTLRKERAALLGYDNHAEVSLATKMATLDRAQSLLEDLRARSWNAATKDLTEVREFATSKGVTEELRQWDVSYWAERLREERFDLKDEELRPYFQLPAVMDGMFALASRLFDVTIKPAPGKSEVWNKDVQFFEITSSKGEPVAYFYLDPYSRPEEKRGGAWMDEVVTRSKVLAPVGHDVRLPVAHMVCNGTPPTETKPSLMTHREVETLFHEFGHALQHMLTTQSMVSVSGINGVEWDAVELPSQFMENWCYHKPTVMGFTKHYKTGEQLPDAMFDKLVAARTYRAGSMMLRQIHFAITDLELHTAFTPGKGETVFDVDRRIAKKTMVMQPIDDDRFLCGFAHIFAGGYSAGYYSYKWAEVLSADAFEAFEDAGLDDDQAVRSTGLRFRDTVLSLGGGKPPLDVFTAFRGREPSTDALLRHNGLLATAA